MNVWVWVWVGCEGGGVAVCRFGFVWIDTCLCICAHLGGGSDSGKSGACECVYPWAHTCRSTLSRLVASCHTCSCSLCGVPFMSGPGVLEGEGGAAAGPGPSNHGGWPGWAHVRYGAVPPSSVPSNAHAPRVPQHHAPGPHWARHPAARVPRALRPPWRQWVSSAREYLGLEYASRSSFAIAPAFGVLG